MSKRKTKADQAQDVTEQLKDKIAELTKIGEAYLEEQDRSSLCDDGKRLYDRLCLAIGKPIPIDMVKLTIHLENIELPPECEPDNIFTYVITVKDKKGNILVANTNPDEVEEQ